MPLQGKKILIIGGSSGIGKATAVAAAEAGARVTIAGRDPGRLDQAQEEIGAGVETCMLDVRDLREMDFSFEKMGGLDHLVITAAEEYEAPFLECELEDAKKAFETKFWGQFTAAQRSVPFLAERGSITLFSGVPGRCVFKGQAVVAAANSAVETLARSLAVELSPIRVNAVAPGDLTTEDDDEERARVLAESLPVRRAGEQRDVAHAVLYLMENQYVTGTVLRVDGGRTLT